MTKKAQSVEPNIADLANGWLKSYKLPYKLEQESLNTEIDQALNDYASKSGGEGGNRPDAKLLLRDKNLKDYPILIEYKGYKDKLIKLDADGKVANKTAKNLPDFKTINSYAVNGAVHYANAILHYTSFTDIIAIGMTGYKDEAGKLQYEIGVYYVSKSNFGIGQKVDDYTDFSFLKKENFDLFIDKVKQPGHIPFVMSGITNTGVIGYISNPVASFPANSITIDIFGNGFYRGYAFGAGDDTGVYWNDSVVYSEKTMLFFTTAMEKALQGKFSYEKKLRSSQSHAFTMMLPTKDGKPDYPAMDLLISAVQKLIIKDVVRYAEKKTAAAKTVMAKDLQNVSEK